MLMTRPGHLLGVNHALDLAVDSNTTRLISDTLSFRGHDPVVEEFFNVSSDPVYSRSAGCRLA